MTTVIITTEELNKMMKIIKSLEDSNILSKGATKTTENETKEQKGGVFGMLLGTLGAILLENTLKAKGKIGASEGTV